MRAIVFSRERAMQLDLLLTSLERNAPGMFDVTVLWAARKDEYQRAYAECEEEHPEARFLVEDGLVYQVRHLLREEGLFTFFTDDDVLYRPLTFTPVLHDDVLCYSLRLGHNTTFCYPHDRRQAVPEGYVWEWAKADGDFSYPMSLDGHIFRAEDVLPLITNFATPNWLEVMLMRSVDKIGRPYMRCSEQSFLVGVSANRVQDVMPNRHGMRYPYSVQELNDRYRAGLRIDLDGLDFSDIRGAHQEIPLVFR